jgi:hypothetical protein
MTEETRRLEAARDPATPWKKWGPYLSERQWGTVREDYSDMGNAWDYFSHDQARSRAYRWGEDGLAGISDDRQILCFALALWNGVDPIVKERVFGLTNMGRDVYRVDYEPAESTSGLFGGNSNWRGPIWFPMNALIIRGLLNLYAFYGNEFTVECPTGSGTRMTLFEVAREIAARLTRCFLRDAQGARPVHGTAGKFQADPHWRDLILFYEYFHGDTGAGLGASHQTGWTGLVAPLFHIVDLVDPEKLLAGHTLADGARASRARTS